MKVTINNAPGANQRMPRDEGQGRGSFSGVGSLSRHNSCSISPLNESQEGDLSMGTYLFPLLTVITIVSFLFTF